MGRLDRQLPVFGEAGQRRISTAKVAVAGCGGLGCGVIKDLVLAGVKCFSLIDCDTISESNLNRQFIYFGHEGSKAEAAADWIRAIEPEAKIKVICARLDDSNCSDFLDGCDIAIDCLDSVESRLVLNRGIVAAKMTAVHAGVAGMHGQVTVIVPGITPCIECLSPSRSPKGPVPSVGSVVSVISSIESTEALKYLSGTGRTLAGRLLTYDASSGEFAVTAVKRRLDCPACGAVVR